MSLGIRRYDSPLRYWVPSETKSGVEYLVDLAAFGGAGNCDCSHFRFRCAPKLCRGAVPSTLLRCNHIESVRDFVISAMIKRILDQAPEGVAASGAEQASSANLRSQ